MIHIPLPDTAKPVLVWAVLRARISTHGTLSAGMGCRDGVVANVGVARLVSQAAGQLAQLSRRKDALHPSPPLPLEEYATRRTALQVTIAEWACRLGPLDYNVEAMLDQLDALAAALARGTPGQQKRTVNAVFEPIEVGLDGEIKKGQPQSWFAPLFADLAAISSM